MTKAILIDNNDSFTGNIYQLFDENPNCTIEVVNYDNLELKQLKSYDKIILSPGPGKASDYSKLYEFLDIYSANKSILGICLGFQIIVNFWGGEIFNLPKVYHGIREEITVNNTDALFFEIPKKIPVGLYHSWAAERNSFPLDLKITAESSSKIIMATTHKTLDVKGVQFHPESYMTSFGAKIIDNWLKK